MLFNPACDIYFASFVSERNHNDLMLKRKCIFSTKFKCTTRSYAALLNSFLKIRQYRFWGKSLGQRANLLGLKFKTYLVKTGTILSVDISPILSFKFVSFCIGIRFQLSSITSCDANRSEWLPWYKWCPN